MPRSQFAPSADARAARPRRGSGISNGCRTRSARSKRRGAPVIAAIHGGCIGAGVDLASACDLRVASADAFFQIAEVDVAITADLGTLQRLGYLIPQGVLRELTYTGRRMGAEEAARYGLVNRIEADRDAAIAAGLALARTIAAKSPLAVAGAKQSLNHSRGRPVEEGLRDVALWNAATLVSADLDRGDQGAARQDRAQLRPALRLTPVLRRQKSIMPVRWRTGGAIRLHHDQAVAL